MKKPKTSSVVWAVARVTFQDMIRDRVLYNFILVSGLLFALGYLASSLTAVSAGRVILDFGMSAVSLSCIIVGIFCGAGLLSKEFDRRTIHLALSRPITKLQFVLGKFLGLVFVLTANWVLVMLGYFVVMFGMGDSAGLTGALVVGLVMAFIQSLLVAGIAVTFSTFTTQALSAIFSVGFFLIGTNISHIRILAERTPSSIAHFCLKFVAAVIPNLEYFNLGTQITYGQTISAFYVAVSLIYGAVIIAVLMLVSGLLVHSREV